MYTKGHVTYPAHTRTWEIEAIHSGDHGMWDTPVIYAVSAYIAEEDYTYTDSFYETREECEARIRELLTEV